MKHKLTNNWGLKLGSLVFAFFLWIIVTNMNDPVMQYRVYNVPVRFTNTNVVTDEGKTYEVLDDSNVIDTVTISGARSVIDSLDDDDIVAEADFNDLTLQNTIAIKISTSKYSSELESITVTNDTVRLNIEDLKTKTLALTTETSGSVSDGYIVGDISAAQNQIRIQGPESLIDQVTEAQACVPISGFTQDIVTDVDIELLDDNGDEISSDSITTNIRTVKVNVQILQTKRIGLSFETMGTPADGYEATGEITSDPDTILVAGEASALKNIENVQVSEDALNITGQTGNMLTLLDISDYLPNGIILADPDFDGNVSVTVYISATVDRKLTLNTDDIELTNIPEGYEAEIMEPEGEYTVTLNGLAKNVNAINRNDIKATVDLTDILEQEDPQGSLYHALISFSTDDGELRVSEPVQIWIRLSET